MAEINRRPETRHVLGLSGGRDSAALAVYMRQEHPEIEMEYFFCDTGKELPEVYEYLWKLEGFLGKRIHRLNSGRTFDYWLKKFRYYLPSPNARWCTRAMKIEPFKKWIKPDLEAGHKVMSYIAIRADEPYRTGLVSKNEQLVPSLPFREHGIDKEDVVDILNDSGLGLPAYYQWRTRSGCTFCFYQQKIEWLRLKEKHPEAYQEAVELEKLSMGAGSPYTWVQGETLEQMAEEKRVIQIHADHEKRVQQASKRRKANPLRDDKQVVDMDDLYGATKLCMSCHK